MAECIVEVCRIERVSPHPNADALELAQIKGWQCVVPLGRHQEGELVTYIPIDSMIPIPHADRWGITKYLSVQRGQLGPCPEAGRVRCARLRGEPSFGVIIARECPAWCEGEDVREHYGIFKYVPPVRVGAGDAAADHPLFVSFTDVENLRNYTTVLEAGEPVIVTEKIHGTNSRVGIIEGEWMAGSMSVRRKQPETEAELAGSTYWFPTTVPGVRSLLEQMATEHRQCILFGEIYGSKIQDLHYGCRGALGYRAFDLLVDGKFVDTWFSAALPVPRRGLSTS